AMTAAQLLELQRSVTATQVSEALLDYVQALVAHTRVSPKYAQGLSPRAGLAVLRASQAWALMQGRRQVLPEDVQAVLPAVVGHRLHGTGESQKGGFDAAADLLTAVAIP
ncbi:MAG TPA: AAA family ATPase, partial [Usitatibacteraceae bacterium]|nr:AAA family ATPase [Usitatibacteraceae bacterium]